MIKINPLVNYSWINYILRKWISLMSQPTINSRECMADFNVDRFSFLSRSHSLYHLKVLETLYARSLQPSFGKQRDCLLGLNVTGLKPSAHLSYFPPSFFSSPLLFSPLHFPFLIFLALTAWEAPDETDHFHLFNNKHAHSFPKSLCLLGYIYIYIYIYIYTLPHGGWALWRRNCWPPLA